MRGSTFKRCGCREVLPDGTQGKQLAACPRLKSSTHGTWYFRVRVEGGKRRQVGGFARQKDAETAMQTYLTSIGQGVVDHDRKQTVGQWLDAWLVTKQTGGRRATTLRSYEQHVRLYLKPLLGHLPLEQLRPAHVEALIRTVGAKQGVGATTVRRVHATLRSALGTAVKQRRLPYNPAANVELPSPTKPRIRPWQPAQLGAFLDHAAGDRLSPLYELIAMTGLRRGEAIGLRWSDVDLEAAVLTVRQQVVQLGHEVAFGQPKTRAGEDRRVDLDDAVVGTLIAHQIAQAADRQAWGEAYETDLDLVFAREDGSVLHPEYVTRHFQALARAAPPATDPAARPTARSGVADARRGRAARGRLQAPRALLDRPHVRHLLAPHRVHRARRSERRSRPRTS